MLTFLPGWEWTWWPLGSARPTGKHQNDLMTVCQSVHANFLLICTRMAVIVYQGAPGFTGRVGAQGVNGSRVRSHNTRYPKLVNPLYCLFDIDQILLCLKIKKQIITIIEKNGYGSNQGRHELYSKNCCLNIR